MKTLIKYFKVTGNISQTLTTNAVLNLNDYRDDIFDAIVIDALSENFIGVNDYYIKDSALLPYPEKPEGLYVWNGTEWIVDLEQTSQRVSSLRFAYLQESDWTDTVSAQTRLGEPLYLSWQIYRQALRDIPSQEGYPLSVTWPTAPE
jgi:hypothetical protein